MVDFNSWIEYVNNNVNNMYATILNDKITVWLYGYEALDIAPIHDMDDPITFEEFLTREIETVEFSLFEVMSVPETTMHGVDPYGLIEYIKAAY